jgi:hypothetical protein
MKRMLIVGSIAALATVGFAGTASAAPNDAACFGQVHGKIVNAGGLSDLGVKNVGDLIKATPSLTDITPGGQAKNALAKALFCS